MAFSILNFVITMAFSILHFVIMKPAGMLSELAKKIQIQLIRVPTLFMTISVCMNAITIDKAFPTNIVAITGTAYYCTLSMTQWCVNDFFEAAVYRNSKKNQHKGK